MGLRKLQAFCVGVAAACCAMALALFGAPGAGAQAAKQRLVTQAVDESNRVTLHGNVHPLARAEFDQGAMADSQPVNRIYVLLGRSAEQQTALDKLMLDQVDATSANYHKWLTPEEYGTKFGPSDDDVAAVTSWLSSHGFTGMKTNTGRTIVEFNGTVGSVKSAFSTQIHKLSVRGEEHWANMSEPQIPAALAKVVAGIPSLHNFRKQAHIKRFGTFQRNVSTGEIQPLFNYSDGNGQFFGMGPADFAKIYNIPAGADGTGRSIAIVARSNINPQDLADFRSMFGLPALTLVNSLSSCTGATPQFCVILNGADPGTPDPGEEGEADLDSEWSGAVAPGATIKFVVSESEQTDAVDGVDASATFIVDNNLADVMSESFGSCEASSNNVFQNALWQQAAAEGITVSVSAGDNGSAGCDDQNAAAGTATHGIAVSGTASTPFNVAVGGTDFDDRGTQPTFWGTTNTSTTAPIPASALGYIPEIPWNESCAATAAGCASATPNTNLTIVAGSGGPSGCATGTPSTQGVVSGSCAGYPKPAYQSGITPADGVRDLPDISFFSSGGFNKSFYIICQSDQDIPGDTGCNLTKELQTANCSPCHDFQGVGGTSASAPAFAGVMALVNQRTGQRQGNANFVLYSLAKAEQVSPTFASCNSSSFLTGPGTQPAGCVFMDITKSNNAVPCVGGSPNCSTASGGGNGVLQSNSKPAFAAGAGYDLATGLGSINVTALLSNWAAAVAPKTTTSTTLNPASITGTVGSSFTLSGAVTAGAGTPTGIVVFENADLLTRGLPEGNIPGLNVLSGVIASDPATLTGGSYSVNTAFLPAGTYTLMAHYGGDATFAPSDSTPISVNLTKQNSTTLARFVNATGQFVTTASVQYGSPYQLRVDVANNAGTTCQNIGSAASNSPLPLSFICPTGTVTLKDGTNPLNDFPNAQTPNATNTAQLNNRGFIEDQPIQLLAGTHSITASYAGDASYNASASSPLSITITQATTTTAVAGSPTIITAGGTVVLTATVSSGSNSALGPSGTVQFQNGSTNLGAPVKCTPVGATANAGASCTATLSTAISAFPPLGLDNRWRCTPIEWLAAAMLLMAIVLFLLTMRLRGQMQQRRWLGFACGAIALFFIASATLVGCGGGSNGGGGGSSARTITARYSGDTNYAASQGTGSVTVQ